MPQDLLTQQLLGFSDCDGRPFELEVGAFLNRNVEWTAWQQVEPDLIAFLEADVPDETVPVEEADRVERLRYAALYILAMRQRRLHQVDQYRRHMATFELKTKDNPSKQAEHFRDCASYCHLQALLRAMESGTGNLDEALELAGRAYDKCGGSQCRHSGIVHHLASLRATAAQRQPHPNGSDPSKLAETLALAERAMELEGDKPYAKYYATRGRILALLGKYDAAEEDVQRAICNEGDSWDYPLRYADYRAILAQIDLRRLRAELQQSQALLEESRTRQTEMQAETKRGQALLEEVKEGLKEAKEEFEESRTSQVELLGFFAGVLALVLAGVQMAQAQAQAAGPRGADAGAAMLILLTGCLLAAFGAFGVLLHGERFWQQRMAVSALGLVLIVGALIFVQSLPG